MKSLILAEKPSVGRDIAEALNIRGKKKGYFENDKYIVTWALGHLVTNATPEQYDKAWREWKLEDLPILPKHMKSVVIPKTKHQFNTVKTLIKQSNVKEIIIATDAGREGELVARLILDKVNNKKPIKRLWVSSVTKKAIQQGFKRLKDGRQFNSLYQAALARSEADWIVGINATRALTTKYDAQLSLGRVQTPTIQLVQARQNEINQFKPRAFYTLKAEIEGHRFDCMTPKSVDRRETLEELQQQLKGKKGKVITVKSKNKKSYPLPLFSLTDLQQAAYQRYRFSAKETLNTLQNLYERHKVVTYPRSDSNYLTTDMIDTFQERLKAVMTTELKPHAKSLLSQNFGKQHKTVNDSKVSDHHAIIPTEVRVNLNQLSERERKLYMMVAERFVENLLPPEQFKQVQVTVEIDSKQFTYQDKVVQEKGYKRVREEEVSTTKDSFRFIEGQPVQPTIFDIKEHFTSAPEYFNEGTLLKAMENPQKYIQVKDKKHADTLKKSGGIGTVATRADIIDKLFNMNAITANDGKIKVTNKGKQILQLAPSQLTSPIMTAEWEDKLTRIERGEYQAGHFMKEMRSFTKAVVSEIKSSEQKYKHDNLTSTECPTCGKFMIKVKTKNGQMLMCSDPSCKTKKNVQKKTNARCPNCKKRMTLFGRGKSAVYRCVCGHSETQAQMDQRLKHKKSDRVSKREMKKYMNNDEELKNNPFADALKNLKL
ncbi:DNA topoisomerase III [Staphylococcus sp. SQ8-PEA]|uniref:DNA topoisomerase 3 n=1 Tax=Staphylococcus marylandisciuri TaxID=2981529 RepID=A0ABT2QMH0_9STAP|nr:DNA topoisomerase III [Staphylococcus marylandisciuri]MCU5745165.1 DNA topoisomerase III [Staphylococcus marylandisciuri]